MLLVVVVHFNLVETEQVRPGGEEVTGKFRPLAGLQLFMLAAAAAGQSQTLRLA